MAILRRPKSKSIINKMPVAKLRAEYMDLAKTVDAIYDKEIMMCPKCGEYKSVNTNFYTSDEYVCGYFPICVNCVGKIVGQQDVDEDEYKETPESVQHMLEMMNLPYIDKTYKKCVEKTSSGESNAKYPFNRYITMVKSLPQYKNKKWKDSSFGEQKPKKGEQFANFAEIVEKGRKRFGVGYTDNDYYFLENEYQDWITRYECNTKAQEVIFERLSFKKWEINNATKKGMSTKDLDKTFQEYLGTANIQPRQNSMDTMSEAQTLGTLIAKWETERPLPDIDPELEDVDKIGKYIDVFYRGHMAKLLGLKNGLSHIYQKFMDKFTVKRPEYDSDEDSEALFDAIFGRDDIDE